MSQYQQRLYQGRGFFFFLFLFVQMIYNDLKFNNQKEKKKPSNCFLWKPEGVYKMNFSRILLILL